MFIARAEYESGDQTPRSASLIHFQVEDSGIGISREQLKDIFSPFKQVGEHTRSIEGTGLGLTISRKLVRLMGGDLNVKSTVGKGSVFYFDLELPETSEWTETKPSDEENIIGYKGRTRKILVTDDRWENRAVLLKLLSSLGFEVSEATDGDEGIRIASKFQPDLIFMDLVMPGTDGFEATRQLRSNSNLRKQIKIIAVSASSLRSPREIISENGFDDFISKPIQLKEIFEKLETHLELEWEYKNHDESVMPERKDDKISFIPSLSELTMLHNLVRNGDIMGIRKQLDEIEQADKQYVPFTEEIRKLAMTFQIRQIRNIVEKHLGDKE